MANIEKFRLNWRSNSQAQHNALEAMVASLQGVLDNVSEINVKLNALSALSESLKAQGLLLQAIADNTACACNGISQVNDNLTSIRDDMNNKLDAIIAGTTDPVTPVPVYKFDLFVTSADITPDVINAGSLVVSGSSTKDGAVFDQLSLIEEFDFIDSVNVINSAQIEILFVPDVEIPYGTLSLQLQQAESGIVQQLNIYNEAPPVPVINYLVLTDDTVVPLFTSGDIGLISTTAVSTSAVTINGFTFYKNQVKSVVIVDGSMFGVPNVTPDNFCYEFRALESIQLPDGLVGIGSSFMRNCIVFNQPVTVPSLVTSIGSYFLGSCVAFNSLVVLPEGLKTIANDFLGTCRSFNQRLNLPSTLTFVGDGFLSNCWAFTNILDLGSLAASVFKEGLFTLSVEAADKPMYADGVRVVGADADAFRSRFYDVFNSGSWSRYRNLIDPGILLSPRSLNYPVSGSTYNPSLVSLYPWTFEGYSDINGNFQTEVPDWFSLSAVSGDGGRVILSITVTENTTGVSRYASLTFGDGSVSSGLLIEQAAS